MKEQNQSQHGEHEQHSYQKEREKDQTLKYIKMICTVYLENKDNINHISNKNLLEYYEFISEEYESLVDLKESLKVSDYFKPFEEIYTNLDCMIIKHSLLSSLEKLTFIEFSKEINYLQDILSFCYGILTLAIRERKI